MQRFSSNASRKRSGRLRVTSKNEDKHIVVMSKHHRSLTAPDIQQDLITTRHTSVLITTVQHRFRQYGLQGCIAAKKPFLRSQNKIKRLKWAREHRKMSVEHWSQMLFSDESKFEIFQEKQRKFVRQLANERIIDQCVKVTTKKIIRNSSLNISKSAFWRTINRFSYKCGKSSHQILLTKKHTESCMKSITEWLTETSNWKETVFIDEKIFLL